jgi:DNA-binding transcriptional LysR family regulator
VIDVRQLQYFVALSAEGTFARAAERHHITQSALSQQMARLERQLGVRLFDRGARGAQLTAAGSELLPMAERVLDDLAAITAMAASIVRQSRQQLRVGSPTYAVRSPARQRTLSLFLSENTDFDVAFENAWSPQLLEKLAEGRLDLSFAMLAPDELPLEYLLVQDEPAVLVVPDGHRLVTGRKIGLADLSGESLLLYPRALNSWLHDRMAPPLEAAGVFVGELEESSLPAALDQVLTGRGLFPAVPWEMGFVNPTQLEGLSVLPTTGEPGLRYGLWLARRSDHRSGAVEVFWQCAGRVSEAVPSGAF